MAVIPSTHTLTWAAIESVCTIETFYLATVSSALRTRDQTFAAASKMLNTKAYRDGEVLKEQRRRDFFAKQEKERMIEEEQ